MPKYTGVHKHGSGWRGSVYVGQVDGKNRYAYTEICASAGEASEARETLRGELKAKRPGRVLTVNQWHDLWLPLKKVDESTRHTYDEQTKAFTAEHGDEPLDAIDSDMALGWLVGDGEWDKLWTLGGLRVMFGDAVKRGKLTVNPFSSLGLSKGEGRKNIEILPLAEVWRLADAASETWGRYGQWWRALILLLAFTGIRPAEAYALRRRDFDFDGEKLLIERQYIARTGKFELPKNDQVRTVTLGAPAAGAIKALPVNLDPDATIFRTTRGKQLHGRNQHYYWHPIRVRFGRPEMDLYELRHFCASFLLNDMRMPAEHVAHQVGHTDGGVLVRKLYGHPSRDRAHEDISEALRGVRYVVDEDALRASVR